VLPTIEQCLRCGRSSPSRTVVPCAADIDGPWDTACTAPTEEGPASAACRAVDGKRPALILRLH